MADDDGGDGDRAHVRDLIGAHKRAKQLVARLEKLTATNPQRYDHIRKHAQEVRDDLAKKLDNLGQEAGLPGW